MDVCRTSVTRVLPPGFVNPERLAVRTLVTRKSRGPSRHDAPYRVPDSLSDGRHTACPPHRCAGCHGVIIEEPCRLCEVRAAKKG